MKTTLDLPDDLVREIKIRAAEQNRRLKDVVADLLRHGLSQDSPRGPIRQHRVSLPLIESGHLPPPDEELTPERVARILDDEDTRWALG